MVARRDAATLLPLIEDHVNQGTIIWSDSWAAYGGISQLPSVQGHSTVNHSIEFATTAGVHTNHIESYWNRAKIKLKRMRGCHRSQLPSYLDELCGGRGTGRRTMTFLIIYMETFHSGFQFRRQNAFSSH